ncbi:flagellar filament capping protein FliD [Paenibacillus sp. sgz302251]|uniref:flagellar filament capping protein FliD n=1 Tax=Paenibacillus sp. sgz302251 TaxID=3414493 RepID=UPI003C79E011
MSMRISGLASGMNTDDIIKQLMSAQRIPMDKMKQKKQLLEWKRDDYRSINNKILEFRNVAFDMKLQSSYLTKKVTSSQENIVSVTASSAANEGQYSIKVDRLAKTAAFNTGDLAGDSGDSKTVASLGLVADTQLKISGDKGTAAIDVKITNTLGQLVTAINNESSKTGVKVTYDSTMDRLFFTSSKTGASSNISMELTNGENLNSIFKTSALDGTTSFTSESAKINGGLVGTKSFQIKMDGKNYDYDITSSTTIGQLVDEINDKMKDVGVQAYLNGEGKLAFYNNDATKPLSFSGTNGLTASLGLVSPQTNNPKIDVKGTSAQVHVNGVKAKYDSNTFSFGGMTFTATQTNATAVNISVTQDVDKVVETVKKFVEKYNSLVEEVNKELLEKKERDFQPLTDAEREELSEDEIKKWEERARNGMLANDGMLKSGLNSLRQVFLDSVSGLPEGQLQNLADIGISNSNITGTSITGSYADRGKLYIDETKLKNAITNNPDEVMALFTADGATESNDGIATRLHNKVAELFKQITDKAGTLTTIETNYSMGIESKRLVDQMANLTRRLERMETRYYQQFTAMEKYISQMNSQSAWLTQQFSLGG